MKEKIRELLDLVGQLQDEARALNEGAEAEARDFNSEEQARWDAIMDEETGEIAKLNARIERAQKLEEAEPTNFSAIPVKPQAAAHLRGGRGDNFQNALVAYIRKGDPGGVRHLMNERDEVEIRASNDTTMNITTAADGGVAVPTTLYGQVIARRDEGDLTTKLGLRKIIGKGTTVDVVVDNEDDGEFVSTNESGAFDRDAPALAKVQMTLVKYTKKTDITNELSEDEDVSLMNFLADFFGRGMAKTRNGLLITAVGTGGTALKTFASATAIAAGEPEGVVYNDALDPYLDDTPSVAWVMRPSTLGKIKSVTGNPRLYGGDNERELLGYLVHKSSKVSTVASTNKSMYFGNWYYVGYREEPSFTMLRDPYSRASYGEVLLHMYFRTVYKVLQAEAIGYGQQAT